MTLTLYFLSHLLLNHALNVAMVKSSAGEIHLNRKENLWKQRSTFVRNELLRNTLCRMKIYDMSCGIEDTI